jgi:exoribonuclease II
MTTEQPIDLNVIDGKEIKKFKDKKKRADWVLQVIEENQLDKDKEFMEEITPLIEELLKE